CSTPQVAFGTFHDLVADQQVSHVLRAAEPHLQQVTPAAADPAQPGVGPVPDEDGLPLPGDELLPAESRHLLGIVVVHERQTTACRRGLAGSGGRLGKCRKTPHLTAPGTRGVCGRCGHAHNLWWALPQRPHCWTCGRDGAAGTVARSPGCRWSSCAVRPNWRRRSRATGWSAFAPPWTPARWPPRPGASGRYSPARGRSPWWPAPTTIRASSPRTSAGGRRSPRSISWPVIPGSRGSPPR